MRLDDRLDLARDELALGLRVEARVRVLDADDRREPLADVLSLEPALHVLEEVLRRAVVVEDLRQRRAQPGQVRPAVLVVDVVRVREDLLLSSSSSTASRARCRRARAAPRSACSATMRDDLVVHRLLGLVQVLDELADAALVLEDLFAAPVALVGQRDDEPGVQERELAKPAREDVVLKLGRS